MWYHVSEVLLRSKALHSAFQGHGAFPPQTAKSHSAGGNPQGGGVSRRRITWFLVIRGRTGLSGRGRLGQR